MMRFPLFRRAQLVGAKAGPERDENGRYISAQRDKIRAVARQMREAMGMPESEALR